MQKRKLNSIEDLKKALIDNGHTERSPLKIVQKMTLFYSLNQQEIGVIQGRIEAKYLYIKGDTPFVANSKFDEVAVDCIDFQCIDYLLSTLIGYKM